MICTYEFDVGLKTVHVDKEIDSCIGKDSHTFRMIRKSIYMIDSDGVCTKVFHQSSVKLALIHIDQRVTGNELIGNACNGTTVSAKHQHRWAEYRLTFDEELVAITGEEFRSHSGDGGDSSHRDQI
jgi:hypothetical protein